MGNLPEIKSILSYLILLLLARVLRKYEINLTNIHYHTVLLNAQSLKTSTSNQIQYNEYGVKHY